jgi:plasmid stabilization system protein ParE
LTPLTVVFTTRAQNEVNTAQAELESKSSGFGLRFAQRVSEAAERIARFPLGSPEIVAGVRRTVLKQFSYLLFYRPETDRVVVLACIHERMNPASWPQE